MKEVLSVFMFGIGALCFVVFFAVLKPQAFSAVAGPGKPEYCSTKASQPPAGPPDSSCGYQGINPDNPPTVSHRAEHASRIGLDTPRDVPNAPNGEQA